MKPRSELFDLIRSLTKSEKRFFKLQSALQSGDKNYLRIFDAIEKQEEYDEEALKDLFAEEPFVKHLPSEKNHLYKLILKSLRGYHSESTTSGILKQEMKNIEVLYNKALYVECNKVLHRAKRIARENERFYYWFELLSWEKMLLEEAYESGEFTKDVDALIEEERDVIEKLRNLAAYHILYSKINYVFRSGGYVRSDDERAMVGEISQHPLVIGKNTALSHNAATICYYIQGFCKWAERDWAASLEKFRRVRTILDENPAIKKDLPKRYIRSLSYIINAEIELRELANARRNIDLMRTLPAEPGFASINIETQVIVTSYLAELRLMDRSGEHEKALGKIDRIIAAMEELGDRLHKEDELEFYFALACVYFGAGNMSKALFWINKMLNENEQTLRQDLFSHARLFNLVIHYELGNYNLLEYIVRSTRRFLSRRHETLEVESVLMEGVRKLGRTKDPQALDKQFRVMYGQLAALMQDPDESLVLKYFDVLSWAGAHAQGVSFSEMVRRQIPAAPKAE